MAIISVVLLDFYIQWAKQFETLNQHVVLLCLMVEAAYAIPNTGTCGIHCVEGLQDRSYVNDIPIHIEIITHPDQLL